MTIVREDTGGKIRNLPIKQTLRDVLVSAGEEAGVDLVRVTSGGQCARGTCTRRTGSIRHDLGNAADIELHIGGVAADFTTPAGEAIFIAFVAAACRNGATGVGAGVDYMGPKTAHIGFGARAVWGAGGSSANAPQWIKDAARAGWDAMPAVLNWRDELSGDEDALDSEEDEFEEGQLLEV